MGTPARTISVEGAVSISTTTAVGVGVVLSLMALGETYLVLVFVALSCMGGEPVAVPDWFRVELW